MTYLLKVSFLFPRDIRKRNDFLDMQNLPEKLEALAQGFATLGTSTKGTYVLAAQLDAEEVEDYKKALGTLYTEEGQENFTFEEQKLLLE